MQAYILSLNYPGRVAVWQLELTDTPIIAFGDNTSSSVHLIWPHWACVVVMFRNLIMEILRAPPKRYVDERFEVFQCLGIQVPSCVGKILCGDRFAEEFRDQSASITNCIRIGALSTAMFLRALRGEFVPDSPLEGGGFELSVPREEEPTRRDGFVRPFQHFPFEGARGGCMARAKPSPL